MPELTQEERRHRAKEAKRLRNEPLFREAVQTARQNALEGLAGVEPNDPTIIMRFQAVVRAIDELDETLFGLEVDTDEAPASNPEGEADIR